MSTNEIWFLAEIRKGNLTRVSFQLAGAARALAEAKGLSTVAVLPGGDDAPRA